MNLDDQIHSARVESLHAGDSFKHPGNGQRVTVLRILYLDSHVHFRCELLGGDITHFSIAKGYIVEVRA